MIVASAFADALPRHCAECVGVVICQHMIAPSACWWADNSCFPTHLGSSTFYGAYGCRQPISTRQSASTCRWAGRRWWHRGFLQWVQICKGEVSVVVLAFGTRTGTQFNTLPCVRNYLPTTHCLYVLANLLGCCVARMLQLKFNGLAR